ncbi:hypothetical protein M1534_01405 [Patescibacteria group bacterium]|nr:hypothetical protein [Patescibacteria group bacterium]
MFLLAMLDFEHDDIQAVIKAAKDVRPKYHGWIANPASSLPEPKAKLKTAIKDRIKLLAGCYIALAGFVDDDDLIAAEDNPEKTKAIQMKVLNDMETAQEEMRRFKIFESDS